jgi:hypothetical protein
VGVRGIWAGGGWQRVGIPDAGCGLRIPDAKGGREAKACDAVKSMPRRLGTAMPCRMGGAARDGRRVMRYNAVRCGMWDAVRGTPHEV